jgi:hypothetical protein
MVDTGTHLLMDMCIVWILLQSFKVWLPRCTYRIHNERYINCHSRPLLQQLWWPQHVSSTQSNNHQAVHIRKHMKGYRFITLLLHFWYTESDDGYFTWPKHLASIITAIIKWCTKGLYSYFLCISVLLKYPNIEGCIRSLPHLYFPSQPTKS